MPRLSSNLALLAALPLLGAQAGCGASDGSPGETGTVRFSQVLDYGETSDFSVPIAAGRPIFVAIQHPREGFLDDETYAEMTLRVQTHEGKRIDSVWPFGFAQYGVMFERPGAYVLLAEQDGRVMDSLPVRVEAMDRLEFSSKVQIRTTYDNGGDACTRFEERDGFSGLTLHRNQRLEVFLVPRNVNDLPMLGLLALTARAPSSLQLDAPLFGQGRRANALTMTPQDELPERIQLIVTDEDSLQQVEVTFDGSNDDKVLNCDD